MCAVSTHPLQPRAQQDGCARECVSTELLSYRAKGLEGQRDVRGRDLDICYMNSFSSTFASAKKCINLFSCLIKNIVRINISFSKYHIHLEQERLT